MGNWECVLRSEDIEGIRGGQPDNKSLGRKCLQIFKELSYERRCEVKKGRPDERKLCGISL